MASQLRLAAYCLPLLGVAAVAAYAARGWYAQWPHWPLALACVASYLVVWNFGMQAKVAGVRSLERVPQVAILLTFGPLPAACLNAAAALVFPFTNPSYRQRSLRIGALRACNNMAMVSLMMLSGGLAYLALGGSYPLSDPGPRDLLPLLGMALAMQAVNMLMLAAYHAVAGRPVARNPLNLIDLGDLLFVPVGVLGALVWTQLSPTAFALFVGFVLLFALSYRGVGALERAAQGRLDAASERALSGAQRVGALAEHLLDEVKGTFRFDEFLFVLADRERDELDFRLHVHQQTRLAPERRPLATGLFGWVMEQDRPVWCADWSRAPQELRARSISAGPMPGSVLIAPLRHAGGVIGAISVQHSVADTYAESDLDLLQQLAQRVAARVADARAFEALDDYRAHLEERVQERTAALELVAQERESLLAEVQLQRSQLDRLSREDALTGLANRREFDHALARELERARRLRRPFCVALFDLDHFKVINDTYGHAVGDAVLRRAAAAMAAQCRAMDVLARYGGEEFALILPECALADAQRLCERIRLALREMAWSDLRPEIAVSVSGGLVEWSGEDVSPLLTRADVHLYEAKRGGRDQIVASAREA